MNPDAESALLETIRTRPDELAAELERYSSHWDYEDPVYRFYHGSYQVYWIRRHDRNRSAPRKPCA